MTESDLTKKIIEAIRKRGGWAVKKHGSIYSKGIPDVVACVEGKFIGLEVKLPERVHTLTALQAETLKSIRAAWGRTAVVTSVEEVRVILDELTNTSAEF